MPKGSKPNRKEYWASLPIDKFGSEVMRRIEDYYQFLWATGKIRLLRNSYQYYYRPGLIGGKVSIAGTEGELVTISVNHFRNLLKHLHTMTTSQPPKWEPQASNTDQKSQEQCILASALLDYYMKEKRCSRYLKQAVEYALFLGEGFVSVTWNATSGDEYGENPETGAILYQGDIEYHTFGVLDVIRDVDKDNSFDQDWCITRTWKNRWDLMAKYPELADQIAKVSDTDWENMTWKDTRLYLYEKYNADDVPVYTFYHKKTEAIPHGRQTTFLNYKIILDDGPIPYRNIPVYRISAGEWLGTPFGYTTGFDLLPVQQMIDALYSAASTNNSAFGVQNVWTKKGDPIEETTLTGGMKHLQSDTKPEPLNLTLTSPELYNFLKMLETLQETLSGVNSVSRGNPQQALGSDASGAAMALIQSMAIQFSMDLQQSYAEIVEDTGTGTITTLRDYATVPRIASITGEANRQYMKSFKGDDLSLVNRVTVDMGNPAMNTTAGKVNMANQLLQSDKLADAKQYIEVYTTGRLEPIYEAEQKTMMLIRGENEALAKGMPCKAIWTDQPLIHINEHMGVLSSLEARQNPAVVQQTLAHCTEHLTLWQNMPPALAQAFGFPPPPIGPVVMGPNGPMALPMAMPGQVPPGPTSAPPGPQGPPNINPQNVSGKNPILAQGQAVKWPQMPAPPKGTPPANAQIIQNLPHP